MSTRYRWSALWTIFLALAGPAAAQQPNAVEIHPAATSVDVAPYSTNTQRFWVVNTGTQANQYSIFANVCTPYDLYCDWSNTFLGTIAPNDSVPFDVKFTAGHAGTSGTISFDARINTNQSIRATKNFTVNARQETHLEVAAFNPDSAEQRDLCLTVAVATAAAYECGDLRLVHALPSVRARGTVRTPTLLYNSRFAHPFGLVQATLSVLPHDITNVTATLRVPRPSGDIVVSQSFADALFTASSVRKFVLAFDASSLATGVYLYTLKTTFSLAGTPDSVSASGELIVVNRKTSPFGAGWWLAGYERIYPQDDGSLLWVGGDGSARHYTSAGSGLYRAPGIDRPDSITVEGGNYVRHLRSGAKVEFAPNGKHFATSDRLGLVTFFHHDQFGQMVHIDPAGFESLRYNFSYIDDTGPLELVTAPAVGGVSRTVLLDVPSGGRVLSFRDPDTTTVEFGYGNGSVAEQITSRTNRRGVVQSFAFDAVGKLVTVRMPLNATDTAVTTFCPAESRGYVSTGCSSGPIHPDSAMTVIDGPRPNSDAVDVTRFRLDRFGAPKVIRDALGKETQLFRGNRDFPGLVTRLVHANGWVNDAFYDVNGLITKLVQYAPLGPDRDAVTEFTWDSRWERVTNVTFPEGNVVQFAYDTVTGNRLWQQDGRPGADTTYFRYVTSGPAIHLLRAVEAPPDLKGLRAVDSLDYDMLGNLAKVRSPVGAWTQTFRDEIGRPTVVAVDITAGGSSPSSRSTMQRDSVVYDVVDREAVHVQIGPALNNTPEQTLTSASVYDQEGNRLRLSRTASQSPFGTLISRWGYDKADRVIADTAAAPDTAVSGFDVEQRTYDAAGNVRTMLTRRGKTVTMTYDALDRLSTRAIDEIIYAHQRRGIASVRPPSASDYPRFPNLGSDYRIAADTQRFTYDELGRLTSATNGDARVGRAYFANGLIRSETDSVRTVPDGGTVDFGQHVYGIAYDYDLNGRLTKLTYPPALAPAVGTAPGASRGYVTYEYAAASGELRKVTDLLGREFLYAHDSLGQTVGLTMPGGVNQRWSFDVAGRLTGDTIVAAGPTTLRATAMTYVDARDKLASAINATGKQDHHTAKYSGLGHVVGSTYSDLGFDHRGELRAYSSSDSGTYSALGDRLSWTTLDQQATRYSFESYTSPTAYKYDSRGRLRRVERNSPRTDSLEYDADGNVQWQSSIGVPNVPPIREDRAAYFSVDGLLRASDHRTLETAGPLNMTFEEYWYDALGRRVLVRTRYGCGTDITDWLHCSLSNVKRIAWNGNAELFEIQVPDSAPFRENDTQLLPNLGVTTNEVDNKFSRNPFFGRVGYTYGRVLDQPLSVTRWAYSDTVDTPPGQPKFEQWQNPFTIAPHWNIRGEADYGTAGDGTGSTCGGGTPPAGGASSGHCAKVLWPYGWTVYQQKATRDMSWHGSLLMKKRDGGGLLFRRSRYFDPSTGRFTQEDPIGLAGGMNLYGFAAGDPVNFGDPFGLDCRFPATGEKCNWDPIKAWRGLKRTLDVIFAVLDPIFEGEGCGGSYSCGSGPQVGSRLRWEPTAADLDFRGTGKGLSDALAEAFKLTGVEKAEFEVTKWGRDAYGKSFPVEWRSKGGAEVSIDLGHARNGPGVPHVGYQTPGKRGSGGAVRGHILLDDVPYNRP